MDGKSGQKVFGRVPVPPNLSIHRWDYAWLELGSVALSRVCRANVPHTAVFFLEMKKYANVGPAIALPPTVPRTRNLYTETSIAEE